MIRFFLLSFFLTGVFIVNPAFAITEPAHNFTQTAIPFVKNYYSVILGSESMLDPLGHDNGRSKLSSDGSYILNVIMEMRNETTTSSHRLNNRQVQRYIKENLTNLERYPGIFTLRSARYLPGLESVDIRFSVVEKASLILGQDIIPVETKNYCSTLIKRGAEQELFFWQSRCDIRIYPEEF